MMAAYFSVEIQLEHMHNFVGTNETSEKQIYLLRERGAKWDLSKA